MKLLVDELPLFKDDCMFAEQRWSEDEGIWVNYCKINNERCDLDWSKPKPECSFLKKQGK